MKKYTNTTNFLKCVVFEDGEAQFLFRGQSITSDKEFASVDKGVDVQVLEKNKKSTSKVDNKEQVGE